MNIWDLQEQEDTINALKAASKSGKVDALSQLRLEISQLSTEDPGGNMYSAVHMKHTVLDKIDAMLVELEINS